FSCGRPGRDDLAARDETWPAFVLAREDEDRIAFGDVLATVHRLLPAERAHHTHHRLVITGTTRPSTRTRRPYAAAGRSASPPRNLSCAVPGHRRRSSHEILHRRRFVPRCLSSKPARG